MLAGMSWCDRGRITLTPLFLPTIDSNNAGVEDEGEYEDFQEGDQGQGAEQGKPFNIVACLNPSFTMHGSFTISLSACFDYSSNSQMEAHCLHVFITTNGSVA